MKTTLKIFRFVFAPVYAFFASYGLWLLLSWVAPYIEADMIALRSIAGGIVTVGGGFILVMTGAFCDDLKHSAYLPIIVFAFFAVYVFMNNSAFLPTGVKPLEWSLSLKLPLVFVYVLAAVMTWRSSEKGFFE